MKKIKGVIYDLDGTIILTQKLHEDAWIYAAEKFGISLTKEMSLNQRGISNEVSALAMLPNNKNNLINDFIKAKNNYVKDNIGQVTIFPNIIETIEKLINRDINVWICTSANKGFIKKVLNILPSLKKYNIIWRELYEEEKPSPEALNLTIKKMGLDNNQVIYVGDALNDYNTSINARVEFIYFCPKENTKDVRMPNNIFTISNHKDIFNLLEKF
ncbi:MAG: HAD-IA family hydrolase [Candidatus Nealsonbacteria bacterium]